MKKYIIVGNLKANPADAKELIKYGKVFQKKENQSLPKAHLAVPFPFLHMGATCAPKQIILGAQNITSLEEGAHTDGVTISMVKSVGAEFCIIGHSEVRARGEDENTVSEKTAAVSKKGVTAIVCVGEKERDEHGKYLEQISSQVLSLLKSVEENYLSNIIIAYEPLWAVNGNKSATEGEVFEVMIMIRRTLTEKYGIDKAKKVKILYGGTVNEQNAKSFLEEGGADGLLVGRASWKAETFIALVKSVYDIS